MASHASREEAELRAYLGSEYDHSRLTRYQEQLDEEFAQTGDENRFYRTSHSYVYNLTAFAMTGTKRPYLAALTRLVPRGSRLLDYGCGIGSDGLKLLEAGYRVEFADFANPSTEYLRWRLQRRGLDAPIHDLDRGVPGGFDGAYALDVIEHVVDPYAFLAGMEERARLVLVNLLDPEPGETELHHELPVAELLRYAADRRLRYYRIFYGRSHLVAYEPAAGTRVDRMRGRVKLSLHGWRRRLRAALPHRA